MKRKCNMFLIITFVFCGFTLLTTSVLEAETFTYTYDAVGNMTMKDSDDNDGDGLSNTEENSNGTNSDNPDTDGDGMPDGWEVANNLNPLVNNANDDPDNDGRSNLVEFNEGTNPNVPYDLLLANVADETILTTEVKDYQAENLIQTGPYNYIIQSGADVTFRAGNIITLKPGFSANGGSDFSATIE